MSGLDRFVDAQEGAFARARSELAAGRKRSHWMWYIFPQIAGLGHSAMSQRYAIADMDEAKAYLAHPLLGPRLIELTEIVNALPGSDPLALMGAPDDMKLHASMTLFLRASTGGAPFRAALDKYFAGAEHPATLERLDP